MKPDTKPSVELVQVINLARRPDRRDSVADSFARSGVDLVFVDAVDGTKLAEAPIPGLSNAETACWRSHLLVMKNLLGSRSEFSLVLEDDAYPIEGFTQATLNSLVRLARNQQLDILQVGFIKHVYHWYRPQGLSDLLRALERKSFAKDTETRIEFVQNEFRAGCHAYLISRRGAETLTRQLELPPMLPIDGFLETLAKQGGRDSGMRISRLRSSLIQQRSRLKTKSKIDSDIAH